MAAQRNDQSGTNNTKMTNQDNAKSKQEPAPLKPIQKAGHFAIKKVLSVPALFPEDCSANYFVSENVQ